MWISFSFVALMIASPSGCSLPFSADAAKGQKLYMKKMKASCGFSGAKFAAKHTVDEWTAIKEAGTFSAEEYHLLFCSAQK